MNPIRRKTLNGKVYQYRRSEAAMEKEAQANARWRKEHYERLTADVPRGTLQRIAEAAARRGISKRKFILDALEKAIKD